jgi:DNA modification methylase
LEETPDQYIAKLVEVFREVRRVLKKTGVFWLNIGDTSSTGSGGKNTNSEFQKSNKGSMLPKPKRPKTNLPPKNLLMIPARLALALQADGWVLRSSRLIYLSKFFTESMQWCEALISPASLRSSLHPTKFFVISVQPLPVKLLLSVVRL